jgi:uncharacterized membrane protein YcaP (DUF421 family)
MPQPPPHLTDWYRLLVGSVPGTFFVEVFIRTLLVYLILMVSLRLMGRRMASMLSRTELIGMVALAAAIGVPMQSAERGIVPAMIIAAVVVTVQRVLSRLAQRNAKAEKEIDGDVSTLVADSVLQLKAMEKTLITRERVFAQLRSQSFFHLGQVKRLYAEANGTFSIVKNNKPEPGLSILPDWDKNFVNAQREIPMVQVCSCCGARRPTKQSDRCPHCGRTDTWTPVIFEPEEDEAESEKVEVGG